MPRISTTKWLLVVSLAVLAGVLLAEVGTPPVRAQEQEAGASSAGQGMFAVVGKLSDKDQGIVLVDPRTRTMCVYSWAPQSRQLELRATRNFTYDLQLDDYNTKPSPREIKLLVEQHRRIDERP